MLVEPEVEGVRRVTVGENNGNMQIAIKIVVNGVAMELNEATTLDTLVQGLKLRTTVFAVERNREIVRKRDLETTYVTDGDRIEIVSLVGGGM